MCLYSFTIISVFIIIYHPPLALPLHYNYSSSIYNLYTIHIPLPLSSHHWICKCLFFVYIWHLIIVQLCPILPKLTPIIIHSIIIYSYCFDSLQTNAAQLTHLLGHLWATCSQRCRWTLYPHSIKYWVLDKYHSTSKWPSL